MDVLRDEPIERAFQEHYKSLCRMAFVLLGDAAVAEETVMDVFADTLRRARRVGGLDDVVAYLRRGVVNRCHSNGGRRSHEARLYALVGRRPVAVVPVDVEEADAVLGVVRSLPEKQRAAVVLTYYLDLSVAEVARILDCSTGTVKSQLSKARATLAPMLSQEDFHA